MPTPAAHTVGLVLANGLQEHEAEGNLDRHQVSSSEGSVGCPCFKGAQALLDMQKAPGVEALTYQGGWSKVPPAAPLGRAGSTPVPQPWCETRSARDTARVARKTATFLSSAMMPPWRLRHGTGRLPCTLPWSRCLPRVGGPSRPSSPSPLAAYSHDCSSRVRPDTRGVCHGGTLLLLIITATYVPRNADEAHLCVWEPRTPNQRLMPTPVPVPGPSPRSPVDARAGVDYPWDWGVGACRAWDIGLQPFCADAAGKPKADAPRWCRDSWCWVDARRCDLRAVSLSS